MDEADGRRKQVEEEKQEGGWVLAWQGDVFVLLFGQTQKGKRRKKVENMHKKPTIELFCWRCLCMSLSTRPSTKKETKTNEKKKKGRNKKAKDEFKHGADVGGKAGS